MVRVVARALRTAIIIAVVGCDGESAATQLVVVVDSDLSVPDEIDAVRVEVRGPTGIVAFDDAQPLGAQAELPVTLGLSPSSGSTGPIEIRASASRAGAVVVAQLVRTGFVRDETRLVAIILRRSCVDVVCGGTMTCERGVCGDADVPAMSLPAWSGDAGPLVVGPTRDAGDDAAMHDAARVCTRDADCDDDNPCTSDECAGGDCSYTNNRATCDDGVFCNGADACRDGACSVHTSPPCAADCDEAERRCIDCVTSTDCGAPTEPPWGACVFADVCTSNGTQTRDVDTPTCTAGSCSVVTTTQTQPCSRPSQEHAPCGSGVRCCGGACVDIYPSTTHCGGCGIACAPGQACGVRGFLPTCTCTSNSQCVTGVCSGEGLCSCDPDFGGRCPAPLMCEVLPGGADVCIYPG